MMIDVSSSYVNSLESEAKGRAFNIIEEMEADANQKIQLQLGIVELLNYLAENKVNCSS